MGAGSSNLPHRLHERLDAQDGDHPLQIIGENVEAHLCSDLFEGLGQKVGRSHPRFDGPERMFDGLTADAHAIRTVSSH